MDVIVYTKEHCPRCGALLDFLNKNKVPYLEKRIEDDLVIRELLTYEYIRENFCDEKSCLVLTPVLNIDGEWMHKQIFDVGGFNEKKAKKLFKIK